MQVLSSTEGVDFITYFDILYFSIRRNFLANIPESAVGGEKGIVVVRFQIQKDGTLPDKSLTIVSSSEKKDMDAAALSAIRTAAPFARLPEGYAATTLDLKFSFFYNSEPQLPAPEQKPRVVPVGSAGNHIQESGHDKAIDDTKEGISKCEKCKSGDL